MEWILFIFKKGNVYYLINADSESDAWEQLQKKLSWNIDIVKKCCKLVNTMNSSSNTITLK